MSAGGAPLPPTADATSLPENMGTQTIGNVKVSLALSPCPPVPFQTRTLEVTLANASQKAITNAAVMMITLDLANLASGNAYGAPARLAWSIYLWGEWHHPCQIYETLAAAGVLVWVLLRC